MSRPDALECAQGFGATHAGAALDAALDGLGEVWRFDQVVHKFHACCHGTHSMLEALATLAPRLAGQTVERVEVTVHPSWLRVCNIETPATGLEAKFSLRQTAAMALDGQDTAQLDSFSDAACRAPNLVALRERVEVYGDDALDVTAARVAVRLADGRKIAAVHDLRTPVPLPDRATKLRGKARSILGDAILSPIWAAITTHDAPDLGALVNCIAGQFPARAGAPA